MAAVTVATVAKKAVEILASNEKGRKFLGYTVGIVIIIVLLPLIALTGLFGFLSSEDFPMDAQQIIAQLPAEDQASIQKIDDTGTQISKVFTDKGLTDSDTKKAQAIYFACLIGKESDHFVADLADCFIKITEDSKSVYGNIENKFSVSFKEEHRKYFDDRYGITRKNALDTSGFTDPKTKNAHDLVEWAKLAYAQKWGYVYGTYGTVLTESLLASKAAQYPDEVGGNLDFIRENWLGGRSADCVGLIKGYGWYNAETTQTEIGSGEMPDVGADGMYHAATEKGAISTIPEIPGLAVWHEGHIGIYIGNGEVIQAANTKAGVIKTKLGDSGWTHWLKIPYIKYE
ncbi:MAG: hypothetical protein PHV32_04355 [Eubacteriales bacterium]|nr:hypothetical protein [Eubacteriales bacterium]